MLPDFLIVGTMKGGTNSLFHYIASHPDIAGSKMKETNFFTTEADFEKSVDWYESLYRRDKSYAFEASPNYTRRHIWGGVPARMHSILPEAKLIYILRDPIERTISHYVHNCIKRREPRSLLESIGDADSDYIVTSKYYFQLQAFLDYYPEERILILESEKLSKDTANVLARVFEFLEIPPDYDKALIEKRFYESSERKRFSRLEQFLLQRVDEPIWSERTAWTNLVRKLATPLRRQTVPRPTLSSEARESLASLFAPEVEKLRRFTGQDFSNWSL